MTVANDIKGRTYTNAVKIRRIEVGISLEALPDKAGLARSFLSGIELGTKMPTTSSAWKLPQALDCKPSSLWLTAERLVEGQSRND